jgi:hypothetical protein
MIVIVSDLRLTDGSLGSSRSTAALEFFAERLGETAARASTRLDGGYRPIETIELLFLGDVIDLMQSDLWLDHAERPWHDPHGPELFALFARIMGRILEHNAAALEIVRAMAEGTAIGIPFVSDSAGRVDAIHRRPVSVRIHYMVGDCDWPFRLPGPHYDRLRSLVAAQLGLASAADQPFPHDPAESEPLVDLLRPHRVVARHGDIFDPIHFDEDRNSSSLGDAIAIEILGRFQRDVRVEFAGQLSTEVFAELAELGNRPPLVLAPSRIKALLERTCRSALQREIKAHWDNLVDRFVELPFVRSREAWHPVDLVDGLLDLLKFSRGAASGQPGAIANWPVGTRRRGEVPRIVCGHAPQIKFASWPASPSIERIAGSAATWPNFVAFFAADECSGRPYEICRADRPFARLETRSAA